MKKSSKSSLHFLFALLSINKMQKRLLTLLFIVFAFSTIHSQSLDDFKRSASYDKGIEIIPFSNLKSNASGPAAEVQRLKEEYSSKSSISDFTTIKKKLLKTIEGNTKKLNETKARQAEYPDITVDDWVNDANEANKAIDQAKSDLNVVNDKMRDVSNTLTKLMEARKNLYEIFKNVLSELDQAKNNPSKYLGDSPSEDDTRYFNNYIDQIKGNIQRENDSHNDEISKLDNAKRNLENLINVTDYRSL